MAVANSQFITFKDGKIGVNFAGFHADAGLGGLLTGDRAHGGLSASAGTPWGQRAAAGINGGLEDGAWGGMYAGAEADRNVGATAALGGSTRGYGYGASEAHAFGKNYGAIIGHNNVRGDDYGGAAAGPVTSAPAEYPPEHSNVIQKVKPPKKYSLIAAEQPNNDAHSEGNANAEHSHYVAKMLQKRAEGAQTVYEREPEPAELPRRGLQLARGILGTISDALGH